MRLAVSSWGRGMIMRFMMIICGSFMIIAGTAQPSSADFDLCKDAPLATMPDSSAAGWLRGEPDWSKVPDVAANPFEASPKAGIAEVYGYNFDWKVYDLGCGNDALRDPQAVGVTSAANVAMQWPSAWAALESRMHDLVRASPMTWTQAMVAKINSNVASKLWNIWFPITVIAAGGWVIWRSRRANYAETTKALGIVLIVAAASVFFLNYPTRASNAIDKVANTATSVASAPFTGMGGSDAIARNVLYPQWLQGEFGSATSPTAAKYGPELFWATHYSFSEYKQVRADQKNLKIIDDRKAQVFQRLAKEIKQNDPVAYAHLTGKDPEARLQAALMAYPFVAAATLFMMTTLLMLAVAKVMLQAFVIVAPVVGLAAAHPRGWGLLMSAWDLFTAALFAAIKFAFIGGLFSLFLGSVLSSGRSPVEQLFWLLLISIVAFAISRPFRTLKSMTPGLDANRSYLRDALQLVTSFAGARAGAATREPGSEGSNHPGSVETAEPTEGARRAEDESLAPLPPPVRRQTYAVGSAGAHPAIAAHVATSRVIDAVPLTTGAATEHTFAAVATDSGRRGMVSPHTRTQIPVSSSHAAPATYTVYQVFSPEAEDDQAQPPQVAYDEIPRPGVAVEAPSPTMVTAAAPVTVISIPRGGVGQHESGGQPPGQPQLPDRGTLVSGELLDDEVPIYRAPLDPSTLRPFDQLRAGQAQGAAGSGHGGLRAGQAQGAAGSGPNRLREWGAGAGGLHEMVDLYPAEVQIDDEGNETHLIYRSGAGRA